MRLILSLTLAWTVFSSAGALVCETCIDPSCSNTIQLNCSSSETMCVTASSSVVPGGIVGQVKACAPAAICPSTGSHNFSIDTQTFSAVINAECCDTDGCNNGGFHNPGNPANNDLRCCNDSACSGEIQCRGASDRCFPANPTNTSILFGCASVDFCGGAGALATMNMNLVSNFDCCDTCLCNDAPTTSISVTLGLIPLLLGLFQSM